MKITRLNLIAYGPFADTALDFAADGPTFHLVYGPNEAGKSTALRALRNLFFGIPVRTTDSFRHPHPNLRIGAELTRSDGETIAFIRRKGLRKTLRGADDQTPLEDDALGAFTGGVDRDLFEQMFAIDHRDLVHGGEEIVAGGGRIGQALFAAGAGLIRLQQVQQRLDGALEALFKPGGSKPRINETVARLKSARTKQKEAQLLAANWKTHFRRLQEDEARQAAIRQRLDACRQRHNKLERFIEALPLIARRKEILASLPDVDGVPDLSEEFPENRRRAESAQSLARNDVARAERMVQELHGKIASLALPEDLLRESPLVEDLQQELGSIQKARRDRPGLEARMQILQRQAVAGLTEAGLADPAAHDALMTLRPALISEIQEMGQAHERLATHLTSARRRRRDLETEIALLESRAQSLPAPREVAALQILLQSAVDQGPLERQLAESRSAIVNNEKALSDRLQRQRLWSGALEALDTLPCPSREGIDRFDERLSAATRSVERLQEEHRQCRAALAEIETGLHSMEKDYHVPTEDDLLLARTVRDRGWQLARRQLEGGSLEQTEVAEFVAQTATDGTLADAFEDALYKTDHLADRLRREAEHVSRKSMLEARRRQSETRLEEIASALETACGQQANLERQWIAVWSATGIEPLSPAEMRSWLAEMEALRDKAAELRAAKAKARDLAAAVNTLQERLAGALSVIGEAVPGEAPLAEVMERARRRVACEEERRSAVERIDEAIAQKRKELAMTGAEVQDLERALRDWKTDWGRLVAGIGLDGEARPAAALAMIESIREARGQQNEADVLAKRIRGIDRDIAHFGERVAQLAEGLAPDLKTAIPEEACRQLYTRLTEARAVQSRRLALERQAEAACEELEGARQRQAAAAERVYALCREAGCSDPDLVPEIEQRARRRLVLVREREDLENRLRRLSAGATVEAFAAEAQDMAPDALLPEMERLTEEIAILEGERSELDQAIGTTRAELRRMDGRAEAAGHAEEAEHLLAALEADVAQYARMKMAAAMLARTIERYREKHQGPLIERASTLFGRMTQGAFSGLRAEYDEKGQPVLMGVRSHGGELVGVTGMSDGTADQLYLALRLASLERYLETSEPLPFIVDDILLRFDDDRAAATLDVLADLSRRTQVIFFTHHHHLAGLAHRTLPASVMGIHLLGERPAAAGVN